MKNNSSSFYFIYLFVALPWMSVCVFVGPLWLLVPSLSFVSGRLFSTHSSGPASTASRLWRNSLPVLLFFTELISKKHFLCYFHLIQQFEKVWMPLKTNTKMVYDSICFQWCLWSSLLCWVICNTRPTLSGKAWTFASKILCIMLDQNSYDIISQWKFILV